MTRWSLRELLYLLTFLAMLCAGARLTMNTPDMWPILAPFIPAGFGLLSRDRKVFRVCLEVGLVLAIMCSMIMLVFDVPDTSVRQY